MLTKRTHTFSPFCLSHFTFLPYFHKNSWLIQRKKDSSHSLNFPCVNTILLVLILTFSHLSKIRAKNIQTKVAKPKYETIRLWIWWIVFSPKGDAVFPDSWFILYIYIYTINPFEMSWNLLAHQISMWPETSRFCLTRKAYGIDKRESDGEWGDSGSRWEFAHTSAPWGRI